MNRCLGKNNRIGNAIWFWTMFLMGQSASFAQDPQHFYIGQDELAGAHVYSILYHNNDQLYVASDQGLYVYKYGTFESIPWNCEHKGNSLFLLQNNRKGEVYCSNMSGQIFKLGPVGIELYAETPKEAMGPSFTFNVDNNGNLTVLSKVCCYYDGNWRTLIDKATAPRFLNAKNSDTSYCITNAQPSQFLALYNGEVKKLQEIDSMELVKSVYRTPLYNNDEWWVHSNGEIVAVYRPKKDTLDTHNSEITQLADNDIWVRSNTKGIRKMHSTSDENLCLGETLFKDKFISQIAHGKHGTYFLGTFNNGIIVIPSLNAKTHTSTLADLKGICALPKSYNPDSLFSPLNKFQIIDSSNSSYNIVVSNKYFFYADSTNFYCDSTQRHILYNQVHTQDRLLHEGTTIKAYVKLKGDVLLIASEKGLFRIGKGLEHVPWHTSFVRGVTRKSISKEEFRCHALGGILNTDEFYYGTGEGLMFVGKSGISAPILFNKNPIYCNQMFSHANYVICATQNNGILFIKEGQIIDQIDENDGLSDNFVKKVMLKDTRLFVANNSGFQIYNLDEQTWNSIGKSHWNLGTLQNFLVLDDAVWFISKGEILRVPMSDLDAPLDLGFSVTNIRVGDRNFDLNSEIKVPYDQNEIEVKLNFKGITYESIAKIEYRINNGDWRSVAATEKNIRFDALEVGQYRLEIRLNISGRVQESQVINFEIKPPFWQTNWFYVLIALTTFFILWFFVRRRTKRLQREQARKMKEEHLKSQQLDSELKALRSQMNPHFIFNSLNSIQNLILKKETDNSYDYIVLFSQLVRNTLNYSSLDYISAEEELTFLDTYLSLEKLRFQDDFDYNINFEGDQDVNVPTLLIQPFVENAIVHGLMHRKGRKSVDVSFVLSDQLICTITDNGVGRKKSKEIGERWHTDHQSFAMEAIEQRLNLLNERASNQQGSYTIEDVLGNEGDVIGTKVTVVLPFKSQY